MVDYPFLEGFVSDGTVQPSITILDKDGATKQQATATPMLMWLTSQRLFTNVYYQLKASQFIVPATRSWSRRAAPRRGSGRPDHGLGRRRGGRGLRRRPGRREGCGSSHSATAPRGRSRPSAPTASTGPQSLHGAVGLGLHRIDQVVRPRFRDSGRIYLTHADGNEVFASYGRAIDVNQNENYSRSTSRRSATSTGMQPRRASRR